jgi:prolyl-tRNA synthetase
VGPASYHPGVADASVLTPQAQDFPRWYQEVVAKAELAEGGPVRGTMVIRPWGFAIWERMQAELDSRIKALGVPNAYFPMFIPEAFLRREAEHVEGFSPELAVVTHAGGKELDEPVVVRPTSETIINSFFAKWVHSWRDLPLMVNQWCNVVRWEMRTRLFLRTTEFLWQEGHTVHATREDARRFALRVLTDVYWDFCEQVAAIPLAVGLKTDRERFAGADRTWTCEAMMGDGKALQMGTSHELGQNFSRPFEIVFQSETGESCFGWQTSWGVSSRLVGGLVMAHGDDRGLRLPPRLAPAQAVVLVAKDQDGAARAAAQLYRELEAAGVRARLDDKVSASFGRRVVDWELKGVPVRLELGPRDLARGEVTLASRHEGTKRPVPLAQAAAEVARALKAAQAGLLEQARARMESRTAQVATAPEAAEAAASGFARVPWAALGPEGEEALAASGASVRCLQGPDGSLPAEGQEGLVAVVARAY